MKTKEHWRQDSLERDRTRHPFSIVRSLLKTQLTDSSLFLAGSGLWMPEAAPLALLRRNIDREPEVIRRVLTDTALRKTILGGIPKDEKKAIKAFVSQNAENALKTKPKVCLDLCQSQHRPPGVYFLFLFFLQRSQAGALLQNAHATMVCWEFSTCCWCPIQQNVQEFGKWTRSRLSRSCLICLEMQAQGRDVQQAGEGLVKDSNESFVVQLCGRVQKVVGLGRTRVGTNLRAGAYLLPAESEKLEAHPALLQPPVCGP